MASDSASVVASAQRAAPLADDNGWPGAGRCADAACSGIAVGTATSAARITARRGTAGQRELRKDNKSEKIVGDKPPVQSRCPYPSRNLSNAGKQALSPNAPPLKVISFTFAKCWRRRQAGQCQRVHAVRRKDAAHPAHQFGRASQQAES